MTSICSIKAGRRVLRLEQMLTSAFGTSLRWQHCNILAAIGAKRTLKPALLHV